MESHRHLLMLFLTVILALSTAGCGMQPNVGGGAGPTACARYGSVCFFTSSKVNYDHVSIYAELGMTDAEVRLPDGELIRFQEISESLLRQHEDAETIPNRPGDFTIVVDNLVVRFKGDEVSRIAIFPRHLVGEYAFKFNGHEFKLPIRRSEVEEALGKPDEVVKDGLPAALQK